MPSPIRRPQPARAAYTFVEVMIAVILIAVTLVPALTALETTRVQSRSLTYAVIGQNLATAMVELVKTGGYANVNYGKPIPLSSSVATATNPLLDFPRQIGSTGGSAATTLPTACPGGTTSTVTTLLTNWEGGVINRSSGAITSNSNYLFFSNDQIAEISGYQNAAAIPAGTVPMDAKFAWGLYVSNDAAGNAGGVIGYGLKHVAVIVKWSDIRRNVTDYCIVETYMSQAGQRPI